MESGGFKEEDFKDPPWHLRPTPLWHLNGPLNTEETKRQLIASRDKSGFSGVTILPMSKTEPVYLSEDYFWHYGEILRNAQELQMSVIFYDDINFPSGSAGGRVLEVYPEYTTSLLEKIEIEIDGPSEVSLCLSDGLRMGAVALNTETFERMILTDHLSAYKLSWEAPAGPWKVMVFSCRHVGEMIDYLNPDAVEKFCDLTYEEHHQRFKEYFGSTIKFGYFDDINLRKGGLTTWSPIFNEKFEEKNGYSPVEYYPALWHEIGPETKAARVALLGFRAELMSNGFPRKVNEWCRRHEIGCTGHAMGQYHPQPTFLGGDQIKFYQHCDIPMIDSIHYYGHGRPGYKLTSSASYNYDRPLTAVEIYGNYETPFRKEMLYRSGMELMVRGANMLFPHGMWYNPGEVGIPPLLSHFSEEIGPELSRFNTWASRVSLLLQGGRHVADIGVLYPIASMQSYAHFEMNMSPHPGLAVEDGSDFNLLSDLLTGSIRRDFTILHPEVLDAKCKIEEDVMILRNEVNFESYRVLVLPCVSTIHLSNLEKIKTFYESGGKVIATTRLPSKSAEFGQDDKVCALIHDLFSKPVDFKTGYSKSVNRLGGACYFVPEITEEGGPLEAALSDANMLPDVSFMGKTPGFTFLPQSGSRPPVQDKHSGMLSYLHKVKDGRNIFFFANSTDQRVEVDVDLRGQMKLKEWNPMTGKVTSLDEEGHQIGVMPFSRLNLKLEAISSTFYVEV